MESAGTAVAWPLVLPPLVAAVAAIVVHVLVVRLLTAQARRATWPLVESVVGRVRWPVLAGLLLALVGATIRWSQLPASLAPDLAYAFRIAGIGVGGWAVVTLIGLAADAARLRYRLDVADNLTARRRLTHVRILRRAAVVLTVLITAGLMLMTNDAAREVGLSLFASAGVAGLVVGIAARPVFANLIAGIQIAFTQPIRIDDAVVVAGEWGWIEDITSTYVVVRLWDWRRLIVPLSHFLEQPFQNWTHRSASLIGVVTWTVDYTVPVESVRAKLREVVADSPLWDGQVVSLQVTECDRDGLVLRGLMSARDSATAWDLRCQVRERLIAWLQAEHPSSLPRLRAELERAPGGQRSPGRAPSKE